MTETTPYQTPLPRPRAIAASGHPLVSQVAIDILDQGGNAFDAIVAAGFVSTIAEPTLTSLGGGGFLLTRPCNQAPTIFDFFTNTPGLGLNTSELEPHFFPVTVSFAGSDQDFNIGLGSVAVPGTLKGLLHVHDRLGRLSLKKILTPAIHAARTGVPLSRHQGYFHTLLRPILSLSRRSRRLYSPGGRLLGTGELFYNHEMANFLEELSQNKGRTFYEQPMARQIEQEMETMEGLLTAADLTHYQVLERQPLRGGYRTMEFLSNPDPSLGGTLICQALQELEKHSMEGLDPLSPDYLMIHAQVQLAVDEHRLRLRTDPSATRTFSRGTTHISIVDQEGNVASMTNSNGEGSGYIAPGCGVMLNNMMGEDDLHPDGFHCSPPGIRVSSMMSPSLLLENNQVRLVIGSGGSKRIRTAISQVITLVIDCGMGVQEAIDFPRLHWDGTVFQVEPGFSRATLSSLKRLGPVNEWSEKNVYFGGVHAVAPGLDGGADPRRGGAVRMQPVPQGLSS